MATPGLFRCFFIFNFYFIYFIYLFFKEREVLLMKEVNPCILRIINNISSDTE